MQGPLQPLLDIITTGNQIADVLVRDQLYPPSMEFSAVPFKKNMHSMWSNYNAYSYNIAHALARLHD